MSAWKSTYKIIRSVLFTTIITVVCLYIALYVIISIPGIQNSIKGEVETELSKFLKSKVTIDNLKLMPFNEVRIHNLTVYSPDGKICIKAETLGAGIRLWRLITTGAIEVTYAELIGLDAHISQKKPDSPLNIDFIIKAFKPKKKKEPTKFDVNIYNIVIRKSSISFDKLWIPHKSEKGICDFAHLAISDLKGDVVLPKLKNDDFTIDLRRLSLKERSGFNLNRLSLFCHITGKFFEVNNILIKTENSTVEIPTVKLEYTSLKDIRESLYSNKIPLSVNGEIFLPDFQVLQPVFGKIPDKYSLKLRAVGNLNYFELQNLNIQNSEKTMNLEMKGNVSSVTDLSELSMSINKMSLLWNSEYINTLIKSQIIKNSQVEHYLRLLGKSGLVVDGEFSKLKKKGVANFKIGTECGNIEGIVNAKFKGESISLKDFDLSCEILSENIQLGNILDNPKFGSMDLSINSDLSCIGKDVNGKIDIHVDEIDYNGNAYTGIAIYAEKNNKDIFSSILSENDLLDVSVNVNAFLDGPESRIDGDIDLRHIAALPLGIIKKGDGDVTASGKVALSLKGDKIDNLTGGVSVHDLLLNLPQKKSFSLNHLSFSSEINENSKRYLLISDFLNGELKGDFKFEHLSKIVNGIIAKSFPSVGEPYYSKSFKDKAEYSITIKPDQKFAEFMNLSIRPGVDIEIAGKLDARDGFGNVCLKAPYLVQGKDKLIKNTCLDIIMDADKGVSAKMRTDFPMKNDRADLNLLLTTFNDNIFANASWTFQENKTAEGEVKISSHLGKNTISGKLEMYADIIPTSFHLNGADWQISSSQLYYSDKYFKVNDLKIWHANQYLNINGVASSKDSDVVKVRLSDINLNYIFDTLNINYVTFGGDATGVITASSVFSSHPDIRTQYLKVRNLSYNNTVLGDGDLKSYFDNEEKMVSIYADIKKDDDSGAKVNGGIYVTRDSLSFDIEAAHVDLKLVKPFMEGFTSDVGGKGSGKLKLFGSFKDIDLIGRAFADSISLKVDYTNVYYHASDSVYFNPGMIVIPPLKVYDKYGNSADLEGYVKHRYFHEPEFRFDLTNARKILCYDTTPVMNPDWYGHVFASGTGRLVGAPGAIRMMLDVSTDNKSSFTFALNDTQVASEYNFLTFKDRNKIEEETVEVEESFESRFLKKRKTEEEQENSLFDLDLRCSITEGARLNLIMDPKAGDKIVARGNGAMQIAYNTVDDEMKIYGKYSLTEGTYNFSLQDLILRDFTIKSGSSIAFNGDVMKGVLDIVAAYRVNTNLSDIDKSFSTDRDLNRTSVPVDALLKVEGEFTQPNISFDISLPTLTEEVERKVKSIISTDDMMNKQIIYLLALNRFYTPEYMGSTSNGSAELASVASTTVSSQLSNFLGQLTDKFTLVPSFRSDKGDFSDMEVDVALSSKLLNNRLLINGNFGYRDKATSNTTFIGDFDIEYLLNKNGNLRLKAYNHFNDQDYYLQSAKTTQGIGLIFRRDFDNPFSFLKRKNRNKPVVESTDSIQ